jgi:predicted RNA binding protein YcfA (HicA-like mRNA interferase family)
MKRAAKTLEAMRAHALDWRIEDLEAVARAFGISVRRPGGSHVYFTHPQIREGISVPARRPIKPPYVRAFVRFVDRVRQA